MGFTRSPLRYPGGKSRLTGFVQAILEENFIIDGDYVEPFAGGAGIACALLLGGRVSAIHLNDLDPAIYAFWRCVRDETDALCRLISDTPTRMSVWRRQRAVILEPSDYSVLELGFAAFFLNRTNRSGVIRGGVIGGKDQAGTWKLGCRFNKRELINRVQKIAAHGTRINLYHMEAKQFIRSILPTIPKLSLVFADPPYFSRGKDLYLDIYDHADHKELAETMTNLARQKWIVSYDNSPIVRRFYAASNCERYRLSYSVADRYVGSELLFFSPGLRIPLRAIPHYPRPRKSLNQSSC